ncbi:MAG: hypothetical protein M3440_00965 [Chloroflexota bacterium]|nr:hypothetical protein [Chloroflexota bacterium]
MTSRASFSFVVAMTLAAAVAVAACDGSDASPATASTGSPATTANEDQAGLMTFRYDPDEGSPGALLVGTLSIRDSCLVLIDGPDVSWVALPHGFRVEGQRLVNDGFEDVSMGVRLELGGGALENGAFDQLDVRDPSSCANRGPMLLAIP